MGEAAEILQRRDAKQENAGKSPVPQEKEISIAKLIGALVLAAASLYGFVAAAFQIAGVFQCATGPFPHRNRMVCVYGIGAFD